MRVCVSVCLPGPLGAVFICIGQCRSQILCRQWQRQSPQWRNIHMRKSLLMAHMHTHRTIESMTWQCRIMEYSLIFWVIMLCIFNTFWQWFHQFFRFLLSFLLALSSYTHIRLLYTRFFFFIRAFTERTEYTGMNPLVSVRACVLESNVDEPSFSCRLEINLSLVPSVANCPVLMQSNVNANPVFLQENSFHYITGNWSCVLHIHTTASSERQWKRCAMRLSYAYAINENLLLNQPVVMCAGRRAHVRIIHHSTADAENWPNISPIFSYSSFQREPNRARYVSPCVPGNMRQSHLRVKYLRKLFK